MAVEKDNPCPKCTHFEVCRYKDEFRTIIDTILNCYVSCKDYTMKVSDIEFIRPPHVACRYFVLNQKAFVKEENKCVR